MDAEANGHVMDLPRILLVEDDVSVALLLSAELKRRGLDVSSAKSGSEAIEKIAAEPFDIIATDLRLGDMDGLDVLEAARKWRPDVAGIVITGHGSITNAVSAIKAGAFDYLTKPVEIDELYLVIQKALEHRGLVREIRRLREEVKDKFSFEGIVYSASSMARVLDLVRKVAATDATVLIQGESGTGKELIARAIHEKSPRRAGAFVAINCGALPEGLLESELFGHVRGAFTGAERNKRGLFEEAGGGTLFLDEISETTPSLQVKLLRALQEGEIRRVGDNHPIKVSVRLVAATNRDLEKLSREGKFREDLYYRLKVFPVNLPPLRERVEDVLPLSEHFLMKAAKKIGRSPARLSPQAAAALKAYPWPGNVRELEHAMERIMILSSGPEIAVADLPPEMQPAHTPVTAAPRTLEELEKEHILQVLRECGNNQAHAAKRLGIARNTLWRKLKEHGLSSAKK